MLIPNRTSTAYDFDRFDTHEKEAEMQMNRKNRQIEKPSAAKSGSIVKILLMAVCAVALPAYLLVYKVELSELSGKISDSLIELEKEESENLRLQAELDNLVTLAKVEDFAKNELGMQKITSVQGKHIALDTGGTTEIAENDDNPAVFISRWFSGVLEYLGFK